MLAYVCLPLPVFVVESTEVIKLGNFFEVLSQFIQLPVFLPVKMSLHEGSDLTHTHTQNKFKKNMCIMLTMTRTRVK